MIKYTYDRFQVTGRLVKVNDRVRTFTYGPITWRFLLGDFNGGTVYVRNDVKQST